MVAPVLPVFGLLRALLARPGVRATARLVMTWTSLSGDLLERQPRAHLLVVDTYDDRGRREADQRRSLLFFRAAPALLILVWGVLRPCSLFLRT